MKRIVAIAAIFVGTSASGGTSGAQEPAVAETFPVETESRFERLDADDNGELAREELFMIASARFEQLDSNEDGVLSAEEFRAFDDVRDPQVRFRALDEDGDGRIHRDELPEGLRSHFEMADANGDDFVDEEEVARLALSVREARNGPAGQLRLMRRLMELDLDQDGRLHRNELPEAMESLIRRFDEYDVDADGYIDGAELRAITEQSRQRRHYRRN